MGFKDVVANAKKKPKKGGFKQALKNAKKRMPEKAVDEEMPTGNPFEKLMNRG